MAPLLSAQIVGWIGLNPTGEDGIHLARSPPDATQHRLQYSLSFDARCLVCVVSQAVEIRNKEVRRHRELSRLAGSCIVTLGRVLASTQLRHSALHYVYTS
jgi:hypothetical protein